MRAIWLPLLPILILAGCSGGARLAPGAATDASGQRIVTITILSTNDFHGRYYPIATGPADATSQVGDPGVENPYEFGRAGKVGGFAWLPPPLRKFAVNGGRKPFSWSMPGTRSATICWGTSPGAKR